MVAEKKKTRIYLILTVLVIAAVAGLVIWHAARRPEPAAPQITPYPTPEVIVHETQVEKIVEVEKEVTAQIIEEGLRDMGTLVTQEYFFTDVISFSSVKTLFRLEVGFTESSYLASYDGVCTAGIDFGGVAVEKDEEAGRILIRLPAAEIFSVDIDPDSFELYSEKTGFANPLSVEDFNNSLAALEDSIREKAVAKGLLLRADENARAVVMNFVAGLADTSRYAVVFVD